MRRIRNPAAGKPSARELFFIWLMIKEQPPIANPTRTVLMSFREDYGLKWNEAFRCYTAPEEDLYATLVKNYGKDCVEKYGASYGELAYRANKRVYG